MFNALEGDILVKMRLHSPRPKCYFLGGTCREPEFTGRFGMSMSVEEAEKEREDLIAPLHQG